MMTTSSLPSTHALSDGPLLHWQLQRGMDALTCEIRRRGEDRFDVQVTLGWNSVPVLTRYFDNPIAAVKSHASITATLMDAGWVVTEHTCGGTPLAAQARSAGTAASDPSRARAVLTGTRRAGPCFRAGREDSAGSATATPLP